MAYSEAAALMGAAQLVVGIVYALFGAGPHIPLVPRAALAIGRLVWPLPLLAIQGFQWACAPAQGGVSRMGGDGEAGSGEPKAN